MGQDASEKSKAVTEKTAVFPPSEEIMRRLVEFDNKRNLVRYLYPGIAELGDRELDSWGILNTLSFAIYDFMERGIDPFLDRDIMSRIPAYISILIDDDDVAEIAKIHYNETLATVGLPLKEPTPSGSPVAIRCQSKSVFDYSGKTFEKCYLVHASFLEGSHGVVDILYCNKLILSLQRDERVHFEAEESEIYSGLQEPVEWNEFQRSVEPYNRMSQETYNGFSHRDHDVTTTSDGSRFLSLKETCRYGRLSSSVDEWPHREIAIIVDDLDTLNPCLVEILPRMGVPKDDIDTIAQDILSKLT